MDDLNLKTGDTLSLLPTSEGILIRPHRFDRSKLAPLKDKVQQNLPAPNPKDIRRAAIDKSLRD